MSVTQPLLLLLLLLLMLLALLLVLRLCLLKLSAAAGGEGALIARLHLLLPVHAGESTCSQTGRRPKGPVETLLAGRM